jgi:hypothetical protein
MSHPQDDPPGFCYAIIIVCYFFSTGIQISLT